MKDLFTIGRDSGSCQNELPVFVTTIHLVTNGIPKLRSYLPFINQPWGFPGQ